MHMKFQLLFAGSLSLLLLGGCMRARVDESRELATAIGAKEAVVVLGKPQIEGAGAGGELGHPADRRKAHLWHRCR